MAFDSSQSFDEGFRLIPVGSGLYRHVFKRALDLILVSLVALPVLVVTLIVAYFVASDGRSPFYSQSRVGKNGRIFRMWKLRSMVPDAEMKLQRHLANDAAAKLEWDVDQKLKSDPRITWIGRLIRKTSIDELPQLWNILLGDMSLVGPRPMMRDQRSIYPGTAYFSMRPGLSGYWQTSDRNDSSFADRALHDTRYFYDISLMTDLNILVRTVGVVLRGTGY